MSHVWDKGPDDRGELLVLLALADFSNDKGECWPSIATVAQKARMESRSVQRICRKLVADGWLTIDPCKARSGCNMYRLTPDARVTPDTMSPLTPVSPPPDARVTPPLTPVSPEPSLNHHGGGGGEREAGLTFREQILSACGVDPVSGLTGHGGRQIGTQADMAEANRWLQLPGITEATAIDEISRIMGGKRDGPPKSFNYFTSAMQRLSGALSAPQLQPETPAQRGPANDRRSEQRAFGAAIQQLADGLSAGTVKLETASRNPW